ncbi:amino acid adenylation domain-containing protein [Puniceibacterium sediminis]|uniref:Amino acid adenylation domain-containing protein n=1 Tax=Puniceibacterium sediminis TaxID=1608407 RepID=A0A238Z477_9RHOB|nr:amino acid adenylation domain-containing protein [Puniceibacterium sediminis]
MRGASVCLDYAALEAHSVEVAHWAQDNLPTHSASVGLCYHRDAALILCVLGLIRAGIAPLILDPADPPARRRQICAQAGVKICLGDTEESGPDQSFDPFALSCSGHGNSAQRVAPLPERTAEDWAYLVATSGSTGVPKCVAMPHRALGPLWSREAERVLGNRPPVVVRAAAPGFDVFFQELFSTLGNGGTLVLCDRDTRLRPSKFLDAATEAAATRVFLTPSMLQMLVSAAADRDVLPVTLQEITVAGEPLVLTPAIRALMDRLPGCALVNQYGPCETHVVSEHRLLPNSAPWPERVPIGKALPDVELTLMDTSGRQIEGPGTGELLISGPCVGAGYLSAAQLAPFSPDGPRFSTGDLVQRDADGLLHYLGRLDAQMKLRGRRVEPAEIEAAILQCPGVKAAAVQLIKAPDGGDVLVGYAVPDARQDVDGAEIYTARLRQQAAKHLPQALHPHTWMILDSLPMTATGKLRRADLPMPDFDAGSAQPDEPDSAVQHVARLMAEVLGKDVVSPMAGFISSGGDSLRAGLLLDRLSKAFGQPVGFDLLARAQSPTEIAAAIAAMPTPTSGRRAADPHQDKPLSQLQEAYLFAREPGVELGGIAAGILFDIRLTTLDQGRAVQAFEALLGRHAWLLDGVDLSGARVSRSQGHGAEQIDMRSISPSEAEQRLKDLRQRFSRGALDAAEGPLFRLALVRLADGFRLIGFFDLLLGDFSSLQRLVQSALHLYEGTTEPVTLDDRRPGVAPIPAVNVSADPAPLPAAPALPLRRALREIEAPQFHRRQGKLPEKDWQRLCRRASGCGVTPTAVLAALYAEVLSHWSETPVFSLNMPCAPARCAPLGGADQSYATLVPFDLSAAAPFEARAREAQQQIWQAMAASSAEQTDRQSLREIGLVPVVFTSLLGYELGSAEAALLGWGPYGTGADLDGHVQTPQTVIDHHAGELSGALHYNWDIVDDAFPDGLADAVFAAYGKALAQISAKDANWHAVLDAEQFLPSRAPELAAPAAPPTSLLVCPQNPGFGLTTPSETVSAKEMNIRVQALAERISAEGIGSGDLVAISAPKCAAQIVTVLAIAATGAAYLQLDKSWPDARCQSILESSGAVLVISIAALEADIQLTRVGALQPTTPKDPVQPPHPSDLAYVIYTSGTTGQPKGVAMSHGAAKATIDAVTARLGLGAKDCVLGISSLAFDLSVFDIFACQSTGAHLALPDAATLRSPTALAGFMAENRVTLWNSTPLHLEALITHLEASQGRLPPSLRAILLSGDWIPTGLPARIRALAENPPRIISLGGATEAGIWSVWHEIGVDDPPPGWTSVPYGRPLEGQSAEVRDASLRPRPDHVAGPLYIGGGSLADGYWRAPEITRKAFVQGPAGEGRLYRTGDIARRHPDGMLELLGREDRQIKLLGHRLEPAEIEAVAAKVPGVAAAVALPLRDGKTTVGLDLSVTPRTDADDGLSKAVETALRNWLPRNIARISVRCLDHLPVTVNGKRDPAALQQRPGASASGGTPSDAPLSIVLEEIARLGCDAAARPEASFFDLGLTSLDLLRLRNRLNERFGQSLAITSLFAHPSPAALAQQLAEPFANKPCAPAIPKQDQGRVQDISSPGTRDIAVVGLACRFPGAENATAFWRQLQLGQDMITRFTRPELAALGVPDHLAQNPLYVPVRPLAPGMEEFDPEFFGLPAFEAARMDPQHRVMLDLAWEALEGAGLPPDRVPSVGVFAGCNESAYLGRTRIGTPQETAEGMALRLATDRDYVSTRVSYLLGLEGPSVTVQTACSSSLVAVHLACQSLLLGECDVALAGGVALQVPHRTGYLWQAGGYASRAGVCRPFDAEADGTVFGSGGGVVVLRPLAQAQAAGDRILAVIKGSAMGNDGAAKPGFAAPSVAGQARTVAAALAVSGVPSTQIGLIEAHGTGTPLGDPTEVAALSAAFDAAGGARNVALGSVKGNIGHLDAAAGIAGLIKLVLARAAGQLPASLHFTRANPEIAFAPGAFYVNTRARPWPKRAPYGGVSALGIGGTNAHVVIGPAPETAPKAVQPPRPEQEAEARDTSAVLVLAARSAPQLRRLAERWSRWLAGPGRALEAGRIAAAAAHRRADGPHRLALAGADPAEWSKALAAFATAADRPEASAPAQPGVRTLPAAPGQVQSARSGAAPAWIFSGQGGQSVGMARAFRSAPGAGPAFERFLAALPRDADAPGLANLLFGTGDPQRAARALSQPGPALLAHVALQCAITAFWRAQGLTPAAVLGVSLGEIAAAHAAGCLSLEAAAVTAANRARALSETDPSGRMIQLPLGTAEARALIESHSPGALQNGTLWIAVEAGPEATVIAGRTTPVDALCAALAKAGPSPRSLSCGGIASHGPAVQAAAARLAAGAKIDISGPPDCPVYPCTQGWEDGKDSPAFDAKYWGENLSRPVLFGAAVTRLLTDGHRDLLEIAPRPQSLFAIDAIARQNGRPVTLRQSADMTTSGSLLPTLETLATLIPNSVAKSWQNPGEIHPTPHLDLPKMPMDRRTFWTDDSIAKTEGTADSSGFMLRPISSPALEAEVFELEISQTTDWLKDHRVQGSVTVPFAAIIAILAQAVPGKLLTRIEQEAPLEPGSGVLKLQVIRDRSDTLSLHAAEKGASSPEWRRIAVAQLVNDTHLDTKVSDASETTQDRLDGSEIYARLAKEGLSFGSDYRRLTRLTRGASGQVTGQINAQDVGPVALHPGVLDAAIVTAAFCGKDRLSMTSGLPSRAAGFCYTPGAPVAGCAVTRRDDGTCDITLTDDAGKSIGAMTGLAFDAQAPGKKSAPLRCITWHPTDRHFPLCHNALPTVSIQGNTPLAKTLRKALTDAGLPLAARWQDIPKGGMVIYAKAGPGLHAARICADFSKSARQMVEVGFSGRVVVATEGAVATDSKEAPDPDLAALWGAVRSGMEELPDLNFTLVDLDPSDTMATAGELALALSQAELPRQAALRNGRILSPDLTPVPLTATGDFHTEGSWLITGGFGGLGLPLAEFLLAAGARKVVLSGPRLRSEMRARLKARPDLRDHVRLVVSDANDVEGMRRVLDPIGDLSGLVHAALTLDDRVLLDTDQAAFHRTIAPKLAGARVLDRLTRGRDLAHFVLMSSLSGILGAPGQANYAAATAAIDALCQQRRQSGEAAVSMAFGPWSYVGSPAEAWSGTARFETLDLTEGLARIGRVLAAGQHIPALVVASDAQFDAFTAWQTRDASHGSGAGSGLDIQGDFACHLARLLARRLGCDASAVPRDQPLAAMGLDSLAILELRNELARDLGIILPPKDLITARDFATIAACLAREGAPKDPPIAHPKEGAPAEPKTVDTMSDAEVEAALATLLIRETET